MRLPVPSTEFTEASRVDAELVEVDRRTATRSAAATRAGVAVAYASRSGPPFGSGVTWVGTAAGALLGMTVSVGGGRRYRIDVGGTCFVDGETLSTARFRLSTAVGIDATTSSPVLRDFPVNPLGYNALETFNGWAIYDAAADSELGVLLWAAGTQAGKTYGITDSPGHETQILVTDIGPAPVTAV